MTLQEITEILASEIECSIFEQHVQPALEAARKMLEEDAAHGAQAECAASDASAQPVAEVIKWQTFTGHTAWDFKVFDQTIEHGAKLYSRPASSDAQAECGKSSGEIRSPAWRANVAEVARKAGFQPDAVSGALICTPAVIENFAADIAALSAPPQHSADIDAMRDAARLDWLDATNAPFKIGWRAGIAPRGNVSVGTLIQLGGTITSIREAIDAAIDAALQAKGVAE